MEEGIFNKDDYKHLRYNVMLHAQDANLIEIFPDFKANQEFHADLKFIDANGKEHRIDKSMAIRYMVNVYDPESPVKRKFPDDVTLRQQAALIAGFTHNEKGKFTDGVESLMRCTNSAFNGMLIRYLRLFNNPTYSMLVYTNQAFYNKLQTVLDVESQKGSGSKGKSELEYEKIRGELMKQADELLTRIDKYAHTLLRGDKNPFLQEDLFALVDEESRKLNLSPESMAEFIRKNPKPKGVVASWED